MTRLEQEEMDEIIGKYREIKRPKEIDWEQRRYEVAKEIYPLVLNLTRADQMTAAAKTTVFLANVLISELKKNVDYGKESL